jgi:hypothetical protein
MADNTRHLVATRPARDVAPSWTTVLSATETLTDVGVLFGGHALLVCANQDAATALRGPFRVMCPGPKFYDNLDNTITRHWLLAPASTTATASTAATVVAATTEFPVLSHECLGHVHPQLRLGLRYEVDGADGSGGTVLTPGGVRLEALLCLWKDVAMHNMCDLLTHANGQSTVHLVPFRVLLQFNAGSHVPGAGHAEADPLAGTTFAGGAPAFASAARSVTVSLQFDADRARQLAALHTRHAKTCAAALFRARALQCLIAQTPPVMQALQVVGALDVDDAMDLPGSVQVQPSPSQLCMAQQYMDRLYTARYDVTIGNTAALVAPNLVLEATQTAPCSRCNTVRTIPQTCTLHAGTSGAMLLARPLILPRVALDTSEMGAGKTWPVLLVAAARAALPQAARLAWFSAPVSKAPLHCEHRRSLETVRGRNPIEMKPR